MKLRPYQERDLEAIRAAYRKGSKKVLFVAPTGYGKTVLFSHIAKSAIERGKRVMILCHRQELIDQIETALKAIGLSPGIVAPKRACANKQLVIASVWTLVNRLYAFDPPDLLVVDEAHHAVLRTTWGKVLEHWPNAARLGVTATPVRLSGEGLEELFDTMVVGPSVKELTDIGFLTPARIFAPSNLDLTGVGKRGGDYVISELEKAIGKSTITGDAIEHYTRHASGHRAIAFCVSVKHAEFTAQAFRDAGIPAESIDGTLEDQERKDRIARFQQGRTLVLTSCDLVSEGFDLPAIEVGILLRPTKSESLFLQQVGRCLRTCEGKSSAIILDHASNVLQHGLPSDARVWSLKGREKSKNKERIASVKVCPSCFQANSSTAQVCPGCGHKFVSGERSKPQQVEGDLQEITSSPSKRLIQTKARDIDALEQLGKMRGYKNPRAWAEHVMRGREQRRNRIREATIKFLSPEIGDGDTKKYSPHILERLR